MNSTLRKRRELRQAIHDAAIHEFSRTGLAGTSTQAIAQRAGISKAQLHYYISSKEDLYREVLGSIVAEWSAIFFLSADAGDPATAIAEYVGRKLRHALEHPEMSRLFAHEMARGAPEMSRHWPELRQSVDEANAIIRGWVDSGQIAPVDPLLFQIHIWAVTQHYADYETQVRVLTGAGEAPLDAGRIIAEATALILRGCGLSPDGGAA